MKYLNRSKVYTKVDAFKNAKKIYIICEGEKREIDYFNFFTGLVSNIEIITIANDNGKSDPVKLKEKAERCLQNQSISLSMEFMDELWFIIDTDRWNEQHKIDALRDFVHEKNKTYRGWFVAQSNPAFEIWLYYHFYEEKPEEKEVAAAVSFKEFVAKRIKGGFDSRTMPLKIQQARLNAEKNHATEHGQPVKYATEVFNLAEQIIYFTKKQLDDCLAELKNINH